MFAHVIGPRGDPGLECRAVAGEQGAGGLLEPRAVAPHRRQEAVGALLRGAAQVAGGVFAARGIDQLAQRHRRPARLRVQPLPVAWQQGHLARDHAKLGSPAPSLDRRLRLAGGRHLAAIELLHDLRRAAAQVQIKKAFGSDEAVKFLLQMSQGMESLEGNIRTIEQAMKSGTAVTEEMARAMNMDIGSQFQLLRQQVGNLAEILGRTLLPVVTPIIQGISKAVLFFQKLARSMPGLTRVLLTLSMALGAVLVVVGGVIAAAGTIGLMLPAIKAGLAAMGAAIAVAAKLPAAG